MKVSECRMAGHFLALLRLLRLKHALIATVTSKEFRDLKDFESIAQLLINDDFWLYLFSMCRALYAPMRVLRLADQKTPAMGQLLFIVNQASRVMPKYLNKAAEASRLLLDGAMGDVIRNDEILSDSDSDDSEDGGGDSDIELDNDNDDYSDEEYRSGDEDDEPTLPTLPTLTSSVMALWKKRAPKLKHDYALVAYLLNPHSKLLAESKQSKTLRHDEAVDRLIEKLLLPQNLTGQDRKTTLSRLVDRFWSEYSDFTEKSGIMNYRIMWDVADSHANEPHVWHKKYTVSRTKVLGKLACLVLSKILGTGSAERHWKLVKEVKSGQRVQTGVEKINKQVHIYGLNGQAKAKLQAKKQSMKGKMWEDADFDACKLDNYLSEINIELEARIKEGDTRLFRAWLETWEQEDVGPTGNNYFHARLVKKYGGLKWLDPDTGFSVRTAHPKMMYFHKERNNNGYHVLACMDGYDMDKVPAEQEDKYDVWTRNNDLFELIVEYYNNNPNEMNIKCLTQDVDCDSEEDGSSDSDE
mmetsp:Transcript_29159/g.69418  ORF Transcript_29159/g.69418 Transcript_29159/m.69418 type:complete len:526 (+) Transcript_29159:715-2292(+)